ncbi:hypothetical protein BDB01DRAFT_798435 [Pilobolus umbonatus]|nr:hypothetical protein BDB01DRAFT_798435 [Pilobolus umbonatus]
MYGVKGTSTILNTVTRQGVLTKQLTAPKSSAILANISTRQVSAGKLSYSTSKATQFNQKQDQNEGTSNHFTPIPSPSTNSAVNQWNASRMNNFSGKEPHQLDLTILKAAKEKNSEAVIDTFIKAKAIGQIPQSPETYETVIRAYDKVRKNNQSLRNMWNAYEDMIATGVRPSSSLYAFLIRSLCNRDVEVQRTVTMLRRQVGRTGNKINVIHDLENEKNMEQALALFSSAVSEHCTKDFSVDIYNKLLHQLSFKGNTKDGLYIYEQLENAHNANPNSFTFAALISLFGTAGDLVAVRECFNEYKTLKEHLPTHDYAYVYNALVYAHVNMGDIQGALDTIDNVLIKDKVKVTILPYNKIVRRACYDNKLETASSLLARLESDSSLPNPDANTYGNLLSAYCRINNIEKATDLYKHMLEHDVSRQYGHIADYIIACSRNRMPDKAYSAIEDMMERNFDLNVPLCEKVLQSYVESDRMDDAVKAFMSICSFQAKHAVINDYSPLSIIGQNLALNSNDLSVTLRIVGLLKTYSVHPNTDVSESIINLYKQSREDTKSWAQVSDKFDERVFNTLFDAAFHKRNTSKSFCETALGLLQDMKSMNIPLTASLYIRVLSRMKKYNVPEYEEQWKKEFAPYLSPKALRKSHVDVDSVNALVGNEALITSESDLNSGLALNVAYDGKFDEALEILDSKIIKNGQVPTPDVIRDMIQCATKTSRFDMVNKIYDTVINSVEALDGTRKNRAYHVIFNSMLIAHARHNDLSSAKKFYDKLREKQLYPDGDAYGALLACSSSNTTDEFTDALNIYEEAKKHHVAPTVYFYNVIISKLAKCRKMQQALQLFDEMKERSILPNSITYASVISACIRCSSESRATHYFQEMISLPKYQPRIGVYNSMIQFYVQQKPNREKALEYYQLLKRHNLKPSQHTFKLLMEAYANIPAYDMLTAHKLLTEMNKRYGLKPSAGHYATLIRSYGCLHRDVQSALAIYNEMKKAGIKAEETVYQSMLNTYIDNNDMKNAELLYQEMLSSGTKSSPYIENLFITGYGAHGDIEKAEDTFNRMMDIKDSKQNGSLVREPSTYEAMVKVYIDNGAKQKAEELLEKMHKCDFPSKIVEGITQLMTQDRGLNVFSNSTVQNY